MLGFTHHLLDSDTQLNQRSYYEASVRRAPAEPTLQGDLSVDVLVVGAGFAGLSAAIELAQRGYRVALLEAQRICCGASGRNGGQAIVGYSCGQAVFEQQLGRRQARLAWEMTLEALDLIDQRIASFQIECDQVRGYLYLADCERKAHALEGELQMLERDYGFKTEFASGAHVQRYIDSPRYCACAFERRSGHLHPLKYGLGLARAAKSLGVRIFEQTPVLELQRGRRLLARTAQGSVSAAFGVLAGNCTLAEQAPTLAAEISARIMPVGTYLIATAALSPALCQQLIASNAAACDNNFILDYFRFSADHRMLFGGCVSYSAHTPANLPALMRQRMGRVFPALLEVPIEFVWGGFVDISMNRAPDFGRLGENLYYLQGFSGHGVALTGLAGRVVAEAVVGQAERFDVFASLRHRAFPGGALLRLPALVLGSLYQRLRDVL